MSDVQDVYPGTNRPITEHVVAQPQPHADEVEPEWTERGKTYAMGGKQVTLYPVGALADALGIEPTTIYKWERKGWLPKPKLRGKVQGNMGGRRRLYTREQIEMIVRIAQEEGVLENTYLPRSQTNFPARVRAAMEAMS